MSHNSNAKLADLLMDVVPAAHLKRLQEKGLSEIEILNRFKTKELDEVLADDMYSEEYPIGGQVEGYDIIREKELTQ